MTDALRADLRERVERELLGIGGSTLWPRNILEAWACDLQAAETRADYAEYHIAEPWMAKALELKARLAAQAPVVVALLHHARHDPGCEAGEPDFPVRDDALLDHERAKCDCGLAAAVDAMNKEDK